MRTLGLAVTLFTLFLKINFYAQTLKSRLEKGLWLNVFHISCTGENIELITHVDLFVTTCPAQHGVSCHNGDLPFKWHISRQLNIYEAQSHSYNNKL